MMHKATLTVLFFAVSIGLKAETPKQSDPFHGVDKDKLCTDCEAPEKSMLNSFVPPMSVSASDPGPTSSREKASEKHEVPKSFFPCPVSGETSSEKMALPKSRVIHALIRKDREGGGWSLGSAADTTCALVYVDENGVPSSTIEPSRKPEGGGLSEASRVFGHFLGPEVGEPGTAFVFLENTDEPIPLPCKTKLTNIASFGRDPKGRKTEIHFLETKGEFSAQIKELSI